MASIRKVIVSIVDWILYTLLSENIRAKLSNTFSQEQKECIKKVLNYGSQRKKMLQVKKIKDHIYTLGFEAEGIRELEQMLNEERKRSVRRIVSWELALYYANQYDTEAAKKALSYLKIAQQKEKNKDQLRRIAILQAESFLILNKASKAKKVLQPLLKKEKHPDLYLAMANTCEEANERLIWLNKIYKQHKQNGIKFYHEDNPSYDDIVMKKQAKKVKDKEKVTVILPAYNAENGVQIAIESILQQTWRNLELLIVDDCSTDNTYEVIKAYEDLDDRVKVFQTPVNSGPYVARNIGLKHASGEYVTINDADDWSHEKKLEIQVKHLQANKHVIANTSEHSRILEETLQFYRRGTPGKFVFPNMSSIMFRREQVLGKIGYWNCVRFAGDGEFKRRLIKAFGAKSYVDLQTGPLSLPRQSANSLTGSSAFGYNGYFMGARKEYVESLEYYHAHADHLYYDFSRDQLPFYVPRPMYPDKQPLETTVDLLFIADFRLIRQEKEKILTMIEKAIRHKDEGETIGVVQTYYYDLEENLELHDEIRKYIANGDVQMYVYGETIEAKNVIVLSDATFYHQQTYVPTVKAHKVYSTEYLTEIKDSLETYTGQSVIYLAYDELLDKIAQKNWMDIV